MRHISRVCPATAGRIFFVVALVLACAPAAAAAQDALARARALRDAGNHAAAVRILEEHLAVRPGDASAVWLLAHTLYWMKEYDAAIHRYEVALTLSSRNIPLRLDYARVLVELRRSARAAEVLAPLRATPPPAGANGAQPAAAATEPAAEAEFLAGLDAYWSGRLAAARDALRAALRFNAGHTEAARVLREIQAATSPWLRLAPVAGYDTQDLEAAGLHAEAGFHPTPAMSFSVEADGTRFSAPAAMAFEPARSLVSGAIVWRVGWPAARLRTELAVGATRWSPQDTISPVWRALATLRAGRGLSATAEAAREPYTSTLASLGAPIAKDRTELRLGLERGSGWAGVAAGRLESFPDDNRVRTAYLWLLAPIVHQPGGSLKFGPAVAVQDSDEDRVVPVAVSSPPESSPFSIRYDPYHTPQRLVAVSAAASATLRAGADVWVSANGSWGFGAEDAPVFLPADTLPGSPPLRHTERRRFHPFQLAGSITATVSPGTTLFFDASHQRTAFYDATRVRGGVLWRFLPSWR